MPKKLKTVKLKSDESLIWWHPFFVLTPCMPPLVSDTFCSAPKLSSSTSAFLLQGALECQGDLDEVMRPGKPMDTSPWSSHSLSHHLFNKIILLTTEAKSMDLIHRFTVYWYHLMYHLMYHPMYHLVSAPIYPTLSAHFPNETLQISSEFLAPFCPALNPFLQCSLDESGFRMFWMFALHLAPILKTRFWTCLSWHLGVDAFETFWNFKHVISAASSFLFSHSVAFYFCDFHPTGKTLFHMRNISKEHVTFVYFCLTFPKLTLSNICSTLFRRSGFAIVLILFR